MLYVFLIFMFRKHVEYRGKLRILNLAAVKTQNVCELRIPASRLMTLLYFTAIRTSKFQILIFYKKFKQTNEEKNSLNEKRTPRQSDVS